MTLSDAQKIKESELLAICKQHQGEHRYLHHGPGSWATTYSSRFIAAVAELHLLYEQANEFPWPNLCSQFAKEKIFSCRGAPLNSKRLEYLYDTHVLKKIAELRA